MWFRVEGSRSEGSIGYAVALSIVPTKRERDDYLYQHGRHVPIPTKSAELCSGSEADSYLRPIDYCITQLQA